MRTVFLVILAVGALVTDALHAQSCYTNQNWQWEPMPAKVAYMMVMAHADDDYDYYTGALAYYSGQRKLPVLSVLMTDGAHSGPSPCRFYDQECFAWDCGVRQQPLSANFPDCCYGQSLDSGWTGWGGKDPAVEYLTKLIRTYKPDVILTHGLDGEYGHPNHMTCAYACIDAFTAANDPKKYPAQLRSLQIWQPKKLYLHIADGIKSPMPANSWAHSWTMSLSQFQGKTAFDVGDAAGYKCYVTHGQEHCGERQQSYTLYLTTVGPDINKDDFFENIPHFGQ